MLAWTRSGNGNYSVVLNGRQYYVNTNEDHYQDFQKALTAHDEDALCRILDKMKKVREYVNKQKEGNIVVEENGVYYLNENNEHEEVHGVIVERILQFVEEELPITPLCKFLEKRMQNPSYKSGEELFDFLEHKKLPICEDGDFLAYKAVTHDFKDKRTRKLDNSIGETVREPRRLVDDDRTVGCSRGLHAGTIEYVNGFANSSDKKIIVKINPKHVVSVPLDCNCQKLRTEEYYVLSEYKGDMYYSLADNEGCKWERDPDPCVEEYEGRDISFIYNNEERFLEVESVEGNEVFGVLVYPEDNAGEYRHFKLDKMEDIQFEN